MKKIFLAFSILIMLTSCLSTTQKQDKKAVISVLRMQEKAWSSYNIESYMQGYWKSDSLKFYGSNGLITYGWNKTLANYKKRYPSPEHTGTLKFKVNDITQIEKESYYVMGEYYLTRKVGDANGVFMIIFKKINDEWKIIADTTP